MNDEQRDWVKKMLVVVALSAAFYLGCTVIEKMGAWNAKNCAKCNEGIHGYGRWYQDEGRNSTANNMPLQYRRCAYCGWAEWKVSEIKP